MNLRQTYEKYMTPKNLQEHMLRVTAISKIITDNWTGRTVDKLAIIKACAIHDIAKPVAFDISKDLQTVYGMTSEDIANLGKLQRFIKENFGIEEHEASVEMGKEMNIGEKVVNLLENIHWSYTARLLKENDLESLIPIYCDMRVGPHGILKLNDRFDDLRKRRCESYDQYLQDGELLEQKIQENIKINLKLITDDQLDSLFGELLNLKI